MRISLIIQVPASWYRLLEIAAGFSYVLVCTRRLKIPSHLRTLSEFLRVCAGCNKNLKNIFDKILAKFRYCMYASNINLLLI